VKESAAERARGDTPAGDHRSSTISTVIVMLCTAGSRLFGFLRQALIGYYFGGAGPADPVNIVFALPNNLRKLFAEGALSAAFIPVLSSTLVEDGSGERPRELVRTLIAFLFLVLAPLVALSLAFPNVFVNILFPFDDPAKAESAAQLLRWMFNYILLVAFASLVQGVLNSHGSFAVPALSPLMFTLATVLSLLFFHEPLGVLAQGVGVLAGGVLQLLCLLPSLRRHGYAFLPSFRFKNPDFAKTARLWLPYLASASIVAVNQQIASFFATGLDDGSASAVQNSVIFLQIPLGIFLASVSTVLFPRMSRQASAGDDEGLRATLSYGAQLIVILLVPSSVLLSLFGREVIAAALQRGHFAGTATLMTARALTGYSVGLVCMGLYTFLQRLFNSYKSIRVPVVGAAVVAAVDIVLSLILKETPLRVAGLAWANSIAFTVGLVLLAVLARRRLGILGLRPLLLTGAKAAAGSLPMAALLVLVRRWKPDLWMTGGSLRSTALIAGIVAVCIGVTLLAYLILRVPYLADIFRRRRRE
jgi:putative peptidoglycan lipid II flippase